jgi:hypothetical protein
VLIQCRFQFFVDSKSAVSNVHLLRDLIQKRRYADNADILSHMRSVHHVVSRFSLEHVKSHQDDTTDFDKLMFPAQLNVLCDRMATNQLKRQSANNWEATQSNPLCPLSLPVEVSYGRQVISSHYIARLRDEIGLDGHRTYLQTKYKWSDQTWALVAWESLEKCARHSATSHHTNRSKLMYNWLNLGAQRARHGLVGSPESVERCCPYCRMPEDFVHLLTCDDPRAKKFRYDAMMVLRKAIDGNAGSAAMLRAIKQWTATPSDTLEIAPGIEKYQYATDRAMTSQHSIGWTHFFRGFVSMDWGLVYAITDVTPPDARRSQSVRFLATVIKAVQDYCLSLWTSRNKVLHEAGSPSRDIVHAALNSSITQLYSLRSSFSPILQTYFTVPLETRLQSSPRQRRRWLQLTQLAVSPATSKGRQQALLSTYFPLSTQNPIPTVSPQSTFAAPDIAPSLLQQMQITNFFVSPTPTVVPTRGITGECDPAPLLCPLAAAPTGDPTSTVTVSSVTVVSSTLQQVMIPSSLTSRSTEAIL